MKKQLPLTASTTRRNALLATGLALVLAHPVPSLAAGPEDNWPNRAIKLMVPFPPGGGSDTVARMELGSVAAEVLRKPLARSLFRAITADVEPGEQEWERHASTIYPLLAPYQREAYHGLRRMADRWRGGLLTDGVGLGKTFVGLMLTEYSRPTPVSINY